MSKGDPSDSQGYTDEELIRMYDPFAFEHHREQEDTLSDSEDETGFTLQEGGTVNPLISIQSSSTGYTMPVPDTDEESRGSFRDGFGRWGLIGGLSIAVAIISIIVLVIIASLPSHPASNQVVIQRTATPADTIIPTTTADLATATVTPSPTLTVKPSPTPINYKRQVTVQASNINGVSLSVPYTGTYKFTITGGSYSVGPVPNFPWTSAIYVYKNEPIQWGQHYFLPPANETVPGPISPTFYLGYEDYQSTAAEAENEALGFTRTATLNKNDALIFVAVDDQRAYSDDPGQMNISVSYISS
jgi:hypothetical protein